MGHAALARRRRRARFEPRDDRELVVVDGYEIPCDQYKARFAAPTQAAVDAMPAEWRALIHEYGADAHMLFDDAVPMFSNQKGMTAAEAKIILERAYRV